MSALLDEIRAHPEDDAPRLVHADEIAKHDPLRAELIVLQCAIEGRSLPRDQAIAARRRAGALLAEHGARWAGLDGIAKRWSFRRGFVDRVSIEAAVFVARGGELLERAPGLRWLDLEGLTAATVGDDTAPLSSPEADALEKLVDDVLTSPHLASISMLGLPDVQVPYMYTGEMSIYERSDSITDGVLEKLVSTGVLRRLRGLALDGVTKSILRRLATLPDASGLAELELCGDFDEPGAIPPETTLRPTRLRARTGQHEAVPFAGIEHATPRVTELGLVGTDELPGALRPQLRELSLCVGRYDNPLVAIAEDAAYRGLETLSIYASSTWKTRDEAFAPLFAARHLRPRVLELHFELNEAFVRRLLASPLARGLEVLDLGGGWGKVNVKVDASGFDGVVLR